MCIAISSQFYQLQGIPFVSWDSLKFNDQCPDAVVSDLLQDARTLCTTEGFMTCGTEMSLVSRFIVFEKLLSAQYFSWSASMLLISKIDNNYIKPSREPTTRVTEISHLLVGNYSDLNEKEKTTSVDKYMLFSLFQN